MKRRKTIAIILSLTAVFIGPVFAETEFSGLDLSADDRLLFSATTSGDGSPVQSALFLAKVETGSLIQLTAFPEKVDLLDAGRIIQIRNPFGAVRLSASGSLPKPVSGFPSFAAGSAIQSGRAEEMAASPDGKWILYVEPVSSAFGRLTLIDVVSGLRTTIAEGVERPGQRFPALWSPDSRVFIYARGTKLYFRAVSPSSALVDERYRLIGDGAINSIRWGESGDFFYLRDSTVYQVRSSELFARALYADFMEIGNVAGKIPLQFDPNFDAFWVAPDASALMLSKHGRNLFYFPLGIDDYVYTTAASLPYLMLPSSCTSIKPLWSASGIITILAAFPRSTETPARTYRLDVSDQALNNGSRYFVEIEERSGNMAVLSPDNTRAVVFGIEGAILYDYVNWKAITELSQRPTSAVMWLGNEELILADDQFIEKITIQGQRQLIGLSSVTQYGFETESGAILAQVGQRQFRTDGQTPWIETKDASLAPAATVSAKYRVYLEKQASGPYRSLPMVRRIQSVGTDSLLLKPPLAYEILPVRSDDEPVFAPEAPFSNGRRLGRRELALSFDLMDDAEGLPFVLDTLRKFGLRVTFFLNGEFIRRHPAATKEIADAGHETASLFFAPIDLSDVRYRIDTDFIHRGLARNEDEFFNATGKELTLLWHAPYYACSSSIVAAGHSAGYQYVLRDYDPLDWFSRADARRSPEAYRSASELVDAIMAAKKPGSIIPIRLGIPAGGRDDYLFSRLDVLIDALVRAGYAIVPVSTLIEHAR